MAKQLKLQNLSIVYFESRHAKTLGDLIRVQGGHAISAPAMKEVPLENNPEVFLAWEKLSNAVGTGGIGALREAPLLVLLTGVGTRYLINILETRYPKEKILDTLKKITIVPRGPKPIRVLNELGVPFAVTVPEPNTWNEILKTLDERQKDIPLKGREVFVQEYGVSNETFLEELKKRGALVTRVPVYRWALPDDLKPLENAIQNIMDGKIHVAMFTTAVQAEHLFRVGGAQCAPLRDALNRIVVASVGPDCSEAIRSFDVTVDIEPESPKMGPLVQTVANNARRILDAKRK